MVSNSSTHCATRPAANDGPAVAIDPSRYPDDESVFRSVFYATVRDCPIIIGIDESTRPDLEWLSNAPNVRLVDLEGVASDSERGDRLAQAALDAGYWGVVAYDPVADSDRRTVDVAATELDDTDSLTAESSSGGNRVRTVAAIPAYNEAATIADVVANASEHVDSVFVVDDGSEDGTAERAMQAGARVIRHPSNDGYGAALETIFAEAARCDVEELVVLDGDDQHDPSEIPRLLAHLDEGDADLVIGSRFVDGREETIPLHRLLGIRFLSVLENLSLGRLRPARWIRDTQSGFRGYSRRLVRSLQRRGSIGNHMGASHDILRHTFAEGYRVEEVGTVISYDVAEGSTYDPLTHGCMLLKNLVIKTEENHPIRFLGIPGSLIAVIGVVSLLGTITAMSGSQSIPWVPTSLTASALVLGLGLLWTGVVIHSLAIFHR